MSLEAFRAAYTRADEFCREVQAFVDEAGIPALNELRYAGYHLLQAVDENGAVAHLNELEKATNHALRAGYEAGEAGILTALDQIAIFKEDYKNVQITGVIPGYVSILKDAQEAKERHSADREHNDGRLEDFDAFRATFAKLKSHCHVLDLARDEMNKIINKDRKDGRRFVIGTIIAVIAIVVGVAATAVFG